MANASSAGEIFASRLVAIASRSGLVRRGARVIFMNVTAASIREGGQGACRGQWSRSRCRLLGACSFPYPVPEHLIRKRIGGAVSGELKCVV